MNDKKTDFVKELDKKREDIFNGWEKTYNQTKSELKSLIGSFDKIKTIPNPEFQDLTLKFYTIHLCNFFLFHIRKILVDQNKDTKVQNLLRNIFSNPSNIPTPSTMNDLLAYLIKDIDLLQHLTESYKKIQEIRHKYAHGASNETNLNITMDEFKEIFDNIQKIS